MTGRQHRSWPPCRVGNLPSRLGVEVEHIHQIANRGRVGRDIWIARRSGRIRKIVTAAARQWSESPVVLDELQNRNMIVVGVHYLPMLRVVRDHDKGNPRSITKEVE